MLKILKFILIIFCLACFFSCATRTRPYLQPFEKEYAQARFIEYSIQVGAFQSFSNADAYSRELDQYVDAFCFKDKDGFFKVRFGNYSLKENARQKAQQLKDMHIIDEYFIVLPEKYENEYSKASEIRKRLVDEAHSYIGVPYSWGGEDPVTGFDCSGLTFSVYRESGIMLPRTSREQYKTGVFVLKKDLKKGDLIFFKIRGNTVSHVGIYAGHYKFIHSPSKGKTVRYQSLNSSYYQKRYAGARTYFN
ncbi:MAG: C40 family peptidase [Desulfobacteraceae bacterium]|nr:C40 family peptidase [Desulfobacteraceae bacterium]